MGKQKEQLEEKKSEAQNNQSDHFPPFKVGPSQDEITQFLNSVSKERETFIEMLNQLYPGLYKEYCNSAIEITKIKGEEEIKKGLLQLDKYKKDMMIAYDKSGISKTYDEKIEKAFRGMEAVRGPMGTLIIRPTITPFKPLLPAEQTMDFPCNTLDIEESHSDNVLLVRDWSYFANCEFSLGSSALPIAGGVRSWAKKGRTINVHELYSNLTTTFNVSFFLSALAVAILGGSYSEAAVGSEIFEGNVVKVRSQYSKIWAIAPFIWYTQVTENRHNQDITCHYNRGVSRDLPVSAKIYCEANADSGLFAGCTVYASVRNIAYLRLRGSR